MHGYALYPDLFLRPVLLVDFQSFQQLQRTAVSRTIDNPPKYRVFAIEMRLLAVRDEELRSVGVGARVCHGDYAPRVMPQRRPYLVCKLVAPYRPAVFPWL